LEYSGEALRKEHIFCREIVNTPPVARTLVRARKPSQSFKGFEQKSLGGAHRETSAGYFEASSFSAISSILVTLFQFLPVPAVFSALSIAASDNFARPMPLGK
jgi:hypothetical protein